MAELNNGTMVPAPRATWESENPILPPGQVGYETDTKRMKVGDGFTPWNQLDFSTFHIVKNGGNSTSSFNPGVFIEEGDSTAIYNGIRPLEQGASYQKDIF